VADSKRPRCAIIAAEFAKEIVDVMIEEARREADAVGADIVGVTRVPGSYEVPLIADARLADSGVDLVVVLGFIERGETLHGEVMGHVVHQTLVNLQLKYKKPVGIGIIGPGATPEQAEKRKSDYARAAVRAAVASWKLIQVVI
jgi:6,7-dimethyl-8-ribityllumazine synthase